MTSNLMKGLAWDEAKHRIKWPQLIQPKVDGVRALLDLQQGRVTSYAGKPLLNLRDALLRAKQWADSSWVSLDVEVMVNNDFTDTVRYLRSKTVPQDLQDAKVTLWVLDLPASPLTQQQRIEALELRGDTDDGAIRIPETRSVADEKAARELYNTYRTQGYEGAMLKAPEGLYKAGKRSHLWIKMKPEDTGDAKVLGVHEAISAEGLALGRVGSLVCEDECGRVVNIGGMDHDLAEAWFANPDMIVGRWVEFSFMERTSKDSYRHPRFVRVRDDKA